MKLDAEDIIDVAHGQTTDLAAALNQGLMTGNKGLQWLEQVRQLVEMSLQTLEKLIITFDKVVQPPMKISR